jgi:hypothetical protein
MGYGNSPRHPTRLESAPVKHDRTLTDLNARAALAVLWEAEGLRIIAAVDHSPNFLAERRALALRARTLRILFPSSRFGRA